MSRIINPLILTLYCSLIFWLSSQQALPTPMLFNHQDKIHHMLSFFIMAIFAWRFFKDYLNTPLLMLIASLMFSSFYGFTDEWHQSYVPGRDADIFDWLADTVGATLAVFYLYFKSNRKI